MSFMAYYPRLRSFVPSPPSGQTRSPAALSHGLGRSAVILGLDGSALVRLAWQKAVERRTVMAAVGTAPAKLTISQRAVLGLADVVLAARADAATLTRLGVAECRVVTIGEPTELSAFFASSLERDAAGAQRIVHTGALSPRSGAADLLAGLAAWADHNPGKQVELVWVGEGDLRGLLEAQMVPPNLVQVFEVPVTRADWAAMFARSSLVAIPALSGVHCPFLAEAMASGLPVLGSVYSAQVRGLVVDRECGWLFDPHEAQHMRSALDTALGMSAAAMATMRQAARGRIAGLQREWLIGSEVETPAQLLPLDCAASMSLVAEA